MRCLEGFRATPRRLARTGRTGELDALVDTTAPQAKDRDVSKLSYCGMEAGYRFSATVRRVHKVTDDPPGFDGQGLALARAG